VTFAPFASDFGTAFAPNQGVTNGTSFTNTTSYTFTDAVAQVELVSTDTDFSHVPAVQWRLDGGQWQSMGAWTDLHSTTNMGTFNSVALPLATLAPGSTHTLRFWVVYPPAAVDGVVDDLDVSIELARCGEFDGALGQSASVHFSLIAMEGGDPAATKPGPPAGQAAPTASVRASASIPAQPSSTTAALPPTLLSQPVAVHQPEPGGRSWTVVALGAALVLAAMAVRMAVGWWSAGRRLP
jgi:hypothetical protein